MTSRTFGLLTAGMLAMLASAGESAPPAFSSKPTAAKVGDTVKIEFAADRETDVAVYILNAQGRVIRHLVAGLLGRNPPPPLKPGLAQSIEWDGKADYGKPADTGPFKVRVAIGMDVKYDKVAIRDENALTRVKGLTVGPDGTVYVLDAPGEVIKGEQIVAFGRDGKYRRVVAPFPANLGMDQVKGFAPFELRGQVAPIPQSFFLQLFPGYYCPRKTGMAVTPDGKAILRLAGPNAPGQKQPGQKAPPHISVVAPDGSAPWPEPNTTPLLAETDGWSVQPALAVSSDGAWVFAAGFTQQGSPGGVVFRAPLPARTPGKPFFGAMDKAGKGQDLLGGVPRGLAVDGKGHLLVADTANGRVVVVSEKDGSYVGEFAAPSPGPLGVDPKTGAIYVAGGKQSIRVAKYSGWKDAKKVAEIALRSDGNGTFVMALDPNAPKPIVWIGTDGGSLIRIEDLGAKFGAPVTVSSKDSYDGNFALDMSVDRFRPDPEVYCRGNRDWWIRYNEETEKIEKVNIAGVLSMGGGGGSQMMSGPDANLYALSYPYHMIKMDRDAKPIGFPEGGYPETTVLRGKSAVVKPRKGGMWVPVSMSEIKHTLGIRADGHIFVLHSLGASMRPPKALHEYLPTGKKLTTDPIIWKVSSGCVGPRFDAAGNIYVADIVNPGERPYPEEFEKIFGKIEMEKSRPSGVQDEIANMYGSIVKFSPKGGMFHLEGTDPFEGKPKLDGLKTIEAGCYYNSQQRPVKITGAEWLAFGYSHVEIRDCTCETTRFDVDEFGRVFYPDLCLYQVRVVDTNGNPILNFGGYGNAESCGPDSPVIDEQTGELRPPKAGEKSPFAEPEIAFAWLVGVGVTDKYIYTGDGINRRILRLKYVYAADETVDVK